jgi:hypothetical protein
MVSRARPSRLGVVSEPSEIYQPPLASDLVPRVESVELLYGPPMSWNTSEPMVEDDPTMRPATT